MTFDASETSFVVRFPLFHNFFRFKDFPAASRTRRFLTFGLNGRRIGVNLRPIVPRHLLQTVLTKQKTLMDVAIRRVEEFVAVATFETAFVPPRISGEQSFSLIDLDTAVGTLILVDQKLINGHDADLFAGRKSDFELNFKALRDRRRLLSFLSRLRCFCTLTPECLHTKLCVI